MEMIVLVDDEGRPIGEMPKPLVHHGETPLHRAFSAYLFDDAGRLLVTRRAPGKQTFPGMWTNTVCGHPGPGEDDATAIARRARFELGLEVADLRPALPGYRYRAAAHPDGCDQMVAADTSLSGASRAACAGLT